MLRSFLLLAALSMSLTSILAQTNLLLNGDFEADFDNPSDVPSWYEFPTDQNSPQTFIQDFGGEDNSNCLFMGSLTELAGVYQNVTLSPSTRYPLSFSLLVVGNQNRFVVESICGNVNTSLFDDFRLDDTNGEFIRRTVYLTTPSSTSPVNCTVRLLGGASRSSNFLLDNVMLTQPSTLGDPVFVGFNGQVYQVHGIPGRIFNIISTANVQFNAMFQFLAKGDSMTREQMRDVRVRSSNGSKRSHLVNRALPVTTAWSHDGSYLGTLAIQFKSDDQVFQLKVVPGAYKSGIASIEVNGQPINLDKSTSLIHTNDVKVSLVSKHIIEVVTSEIHLTIVNSDRFFNIQSAQLSSEIQNNPSLIQGVLGQSADASRYFPKYDTATHASSAEKSDWNEHQIMDYLIVDDNLWSSDFHLNQFQ